ncbi:MAG: hypothetical protein IJ629_03455 [Clostridia bacterium]|nr:hypothetical protein [Clostridia bacterium]
MKKVIKIGFPILCIAVIGGTFVLLNKTTEKINKNRLTEEDEDQSFVESKVPEEDENLEEENTSNVVVDPEEAKVQEVKNKAKAIEIIKEVAPPTSNSYYTNEGMVEDKYLVAVRDSTSKEPKIYYAVDIVNESYEIYVK